MHARVTLLYRQIPYLLPCGRVSCEWKRGPSPLASRYVDAAAWRCKKLSRAPGHVMMLWRCQLRVSKWMKTAGRRGRAWLRGQAMKGRGIRPRPRDGHLPGDEETQKEREKDTTLIVATVKCSLFPGTHEA